MERSTFSLVYATPLLPHQAQLGLHQELTARCTQAREDTHGLDGQHQDVDRTLSQNDRGQR